MIDTYTYYETTSGPESPPHTSENQKFGKKNNI